MAWFGPKLCNCGCVHGCDCQDGGVSRNFSGTPTVRAVVSGVPDTYEFEIFRYTGTDRVWVKVTITGLSQINGTYLRELPVSNGCIDESVFTITQNHPKSCSAHYLRRFVSGTSGCTIVGTSEQTFNFNAGITILASGFGDLGEKYIESSVSGLVSWAGFNFTLGGRQRLRCKWGYDPTLDTDPATITPQTYPPQPYDPSLQEVLISYAPTNEDRCGMLVVSSDPIIEAIGTITAEIIDDVP